MQPIYGLEASVREDVQKLRSSPHVKPGTGAHAALAVAGRRSCALPADGRCFRQAGGRLAPACPLHAEVASAGRPAHVSRPALQPVACPAP